MHKAGYQQVGFTIVELLVVIVVIGILAAITVVAYTGISGKAIVATLQSDLSNSAQRLKMYQTEHGAYPQNLDGSNCPTGPTDINYCLRPSSGNTFAYSSSSPYSTFSLTATNTNGTSYRITDGTGPVAYVPIVVTGGNTVTTDGLYTVRTFTSSGTLAVTGGTITGAQVLVVGGGGGGGGGAQAQSYGNGGNAGQYLTGSENLTGTMGVTVGGGGTAGGTYPTSGGTGGPSMFGTRTASGGGGGDHVTNTGAGYSGNGAGGSGGFNAAGGIGLYSEITGTSVGRAGGGAQCGGSASEGGGGPSSAGDANKGGGGGGHRDQGAGGDGGSGIVIIRYLTPSS